MKLLEGRQRGEQVLLLVTALWGTTFLVIQDALADVRPFMVTAVRFCVATLGLLPAALQQIRTMDTETRQRLRRFVADGAVLGLFAFFGFALQTLSLQYTTQAHCAFGTSLVTVMVPPLATLIVRAPWHLSTTVALAAAASGASLLLGQPLSPDARWGDALAVGSAGAFAVQIMLLGLCARRSAVLVLVTVEVAVVAALSTVACLWRQEAVPNSATAWGPLLYLGAVATAGCLLGQVWGQARTTPTRAAFLYALEPLFAAAFAWGLRGQALRPAELVGGGFMVAAAMVADRPTPRWLTRARPKKPAGATPPSAAAPDERGDRR